MKHAFLFAAALAGLTLPALIERNAGEATAQTFQHSESKEIPPEDIVINLSDLKGIHVFRANSRMQNKEVVNQRFHFLRGLVDIQYAPIGAFNQTATASVQQPDEVEDRIHRLFKVPRDDVRLVESRTLYAFNERGGWLHAFRIGEATHACFLSDAAFLSEPGKNWDAAERYDTLVLLLDCSGERSIDETEAWLKGMSIVSPGYNRQKMKQ